jgi:hypothetical protein
MGPKHPFGLGGQDLLVDGGFVSYLMSLVPRPPPPGRS